MFQREIDKLWELHPKDVRKSTVLAILYKRSTIISYGFNRRKFQYIAGLRHYRFTIHAEDAAITKAGVRARGAKMLVYRIRKDGTYGSAAPCKICKSRIEKAGVDIVRYT